MYHFSMPLTYFKLFDTIFIFYYMFEYFAFSLNICVSLLLCLFMLYHSRWFFSRGSRIQSCIWLSWDNTWVDLIILVMIECDVILGVDWLSMYSVILDFHAKIVTLMMQTVSKLDWKVTQGSYLMRVNLSSILADGWERMCNTPYYS